MKKFLSIILTVVLVTSLVVISLVTSASTTEKTLLIDWNANATSQGYYEGGWSIDTSTDGYIHLTGAKRGRFYQSWGWLKTITEYGGLSFTAYCAEGSANTSLQLMFGSGANNKIAHLTPTPQEFNFTYADFGFESRSVMSGDFGFYSLTPNSTDVPNADVYISDIYVYAADGEGAATTVPTETETTTTAPVGAGITFDDNDMSFVTTVGTACSAEIANGALKVGMNQWDSDLTVTNYARIEIDTTGLTDLEFDAWQSVGTGWDGTDKGSHYGLEIDGVVYWDTPYASGHINSKSTKTFSVVGVNYYSLADNSFSENGTYNVKKKMTADDIQNIDAICIRPGNHYNAQYANIDNITAAKPGEAPVVDPYENIAGTTSVEAQLRIGKVNGIRFITNVNADLIETAKSEGYTVTMGTLIAPLTYGELKLDSGAINVVTPGYFFETPGVIAGSIVSIKTANITKDFVARGYVTLTKDEVSTTYYASQPDEGRSLKTVAAACVEDISFFNMLNDAQKEQVTTWATWANA